MPRRLVLASRVLFFLSGPLIAAGVVCMVAGILDADEIAARLLERIMAEIDAESLARLPPDFLTSAMVRQAALALGLGFLLVGFGQLATAIGLRRDARWSYAAAVVGGLFVAFTCGATAVFMLAATSTQPQAATSAGRGWHRSGKRSRPVRHDRGPYRCRTARARRSAARVSGVRPDRLTGAVGDAWYTPPPPLRARGVVAQHACLSRRRSPVRIRSGPPSFLARRGNPRANPRRRCALVAPDQVARRTRRQHVLTAPGTASR